MAIKDKLGSYITRTIVWRLALWSLSLTSLVLLVFLWLSGTHDTEEAMSDGRRLLIQLENGAIEGKQISLETLKPETAAPVAAPEAAAEPDKEPQATPAATAASTPATTQSNAAATDSASAKAVESPSAAASSPAVPSLAEAAIKPASVPPAEVKDVLIEKTDIGNLPIIGPKNLKPWVYYSKRYVHKGHLPTIAIVITGLGQNKVATEAAIKLPENISLGFSPYAKDATSWAHAARIAGHEILVDLPLEPSNFPASDPGPYGLLVGKGLEENNKRLKWLMSRLEGYVGFITPLNESYSSDDASFKDLLDQLATRGLMLSMPHDPAKNDTRKILDTSKAAYSIADSIVDEELSASSIQARLLSLEKTASKRGFAVGIAQPFPLTMQQLALWAADLEKKGFMLVPMTFITKIKFSAN